MVVFGLKDFAGGFGFLKEPVEACDGFVGCIREIFAKEAKNLCCWFSKLDLATFLILLSYNTLELIGVFLKACQEWSIRNFEEAIAELRPAWSNLMAKSR